MRITSWLPAATLFAMVWALSACTTEADRLYRRAKDAAEEQADYETAIQYVDLAIERDPGNGSYHRRRGDWLRELGRNDEALLAYSEAIGARDPSESAHLKGIRLCLELGRLDEAQRRIDIARAELSDRDDLEEVEELQQELQQARDGAAPPDPAGEEASAPPAGESPPGESVEAIGSPQSATPEGVAFVQWSFLNEVDLLEFRIQRGETREGPWTLIDTVPARGEGIHGPRQYTYEDRGFEIGEVLYYVVDYENLEGVSFRAGPLEYVAQAEEIDD